MIRHYPAELTWRSYDEFMQKFPNRQRILAFLLSGLLLITTACQSDRTSPAVIPPNPPAVIADPPQAAARTEVPKPVPLARQALENLEYQGIYAQAVKLAHGEFVGPPLEVGGASRPTVTLQTLALGDLDQDRLTDAIVVLAENSGGSGTFIYLAAVLNKNELPVNTSTILLGDRVRVQSLQVLDGRIVVTALTHAPEDPLCCPSQEVKTTYLLDAGQLIPLENN